MDEGPKYYVRLKLKRHPGIKPDDLIQLFQQLGTLVTSGTPILQSMHLAADQVESGKLSKIVREIADAIARGQPLYAAAAEYPKLFKSHWIQMLRVGEMTGQLGGILVELREHLEKQKAIRAKIMGALTYPIILSCVAVASVTVMLWKVIPTFAEFFDSMGGKLPAITVYVLKMSNFVQHRGLHVLGAAIVVFFSLKKYLSTPRGNDLACKLMMATPGLGEFMVVSVMEKFSGNLGLLLKSGIPLLEALKTVREMFIKNTIYYDTVGEVQEKVARGMGLAVALESTYLFAPMVTNMVRIGEESGKLSEILAEVAKFYATKVENQLLSLTGMLEPLIVIGMGVAVAGLLGSVYLPMFQLSAGGAG